MSVQSYRDLAVWQKAIDLVAQCYLVTQAFPKTEIYGLTSQLRRAAVSVPANIAEGQARQHTGEFLQFLCIARGSLAELETHIIIAARLNYIQAEQSAELLAQSTEVAKMISGLYKSLETKRSQ